MYLTLACALWVWNPKRFFTITFSVRQKATNGFALVVQVQYVLLHYRLQRDFKGLYMKSSFIHSCDKSRLP